MSPDEYLLGADPAELERLAFQHAVWRPVTSAFLKRLGVAPGWQCLDAGCGPGFVSQLLREFVGPSGNVVGIDQSARMIASARRHLRGESWSNVEFREGFLDEASVPAGPFDLVYLRWVLSFVPDPGAVVRLLAERLKPGGVIAIQDYNHEGVSIFPDSPGFRRVIDVTRELYADSGGDAFIVGRLPGLLREAGLELVDLHPNVLCGGPEDDAFRWMDAFFGPFTEQCVEDGRLTSEERERFLREWEERRANPDTIAFSPIVVDVAGLRGRF